MARKAWRMRMAYMHPYPLYLPLTCPYPLYALTPYMARTPYIARVWHSAWRVRRGEWRMAYMHPYPLYVPLTCPYPLCPYPLYGPDGIARARLDTGRYYTLLITHPTRPILCL